MSYMYGEWLTQKEKAAMQPKLQWPALRKAIHEMQMDNGYSDEAGASRALAKVESDLPAVVMMMAEQWVEKLVPSDLEVVCSGEDCGPIEFNGRLMRGANGVTVRVPDFVHETLDYLFDVM